MVAVPVQTPMPIPLTGPRNDPRDDPRNYLRTNVTRDGGLFRDSILVALENTNHSRVNYLYTNYVVHQVTDWHQNSSIEVI